MMEARAVEKYLHEHIPLSAAMEVAVLEATPNVVRLSAPLSPNVNHRGTVFGGSASAVAILSAWTLLYLRLKGEHVECNLVIQKNAMTYTCPITDRFTASASLHDPVVWSRFLNTLGRRNRARIGVTSILHCNEEKVGEFDGDFVAMGR
ncbi:MAG: YiiD C-terminal domain-containing protein [Verrucomicrobiota bacterium]